MICSMLTACCLLLVAYCFPNVAVAVAVGYLTFNYFGYGYGNSNSKILLFVWGMNHHRYQI